MSKRENKLAIEAERGGRGSVHKSVTAVSQRPKSNKECDGLRWGVNIFHIVPKIATKDMLIARFLKVFERV